MAVARIQISIPDNVQLIFLLFLPYHSQSSTKPTTDIVTINMEVMTLLQNGWIPWLQDGSHIIRPISIKC